jgi:threonylcarbamoyladenosine tRNA methylthiotransferase MtaB
MSDILVRAMRTFSVMTLGCKVNHYESEQIASFLRARGWVQTAAADAKLRIVNTCCVTTDAASQSRQSVRRALRLPVLRSGDAAGSSPIGASKVIACGCWATAEPEAAAAMPGVTAVLTHRDNISQILTDLVQQWEEDGSDVSPEPAPIAPVRATVGSVGATTLPLLGESQPSHQRAFLKIQDGCDAFCTYCIIPSLRSVLWSKPIDDAVNEARRLVDAGHVEIVLTGIFLGAYGHATALRRRQNAAESFPLAQLIDALCTRVPGLRRLRLSSLEPGDLNDGLFSVLRAHRQVVPHLHLPLQSGSDRLLRRMNRQYTRDDYLRLLDRVAAAWDRAALTTDIIVGFPGESDHCFDQTLDIVNRARFIHVHAFPFSPRPGTAAARWRGEFVHGTTVAQRLDELTRLAAAHSHQFRAGFVGQTVEVLTERNRATDSPEMRHGRCERYFDVQFHAPSVRPGDLVTLRIERATPTQTFGVVETGGQSP